MSSTVASGRLRKQIVLERAAFTTNALNERVPGWSTLKAVFANVGYVGGGEGLAAQQVNATLVTRFRIRWDSALAGLNPKDRLRFDGRIYDIKDVFEIGHREGLDIRAVAQADS